MRNSLTIAALAALLATAAQAADNFAIRVYPAPKLAGALQLDGKLDDPAWRAAPVVSGFSGYEDNKLAAVQAGFQVLYDDQYLYFGFHCDEPNMAALKPAVLARDEHAIFRTETIELFLDPGHTHDLYYQLAFNAAGSLYDGERTGTQWNSEAVVATHLGPDFWSVELAVPWRVLGGAPTPGRVLGFNVNRNRHLGTGTENLTWTQVNADFHDPLRYAHLVLSGTPESIARLGPELRRGERTGAIWVFGPEGFAEQSYRQLAAAELARLDELLTDLETQQKRERNPRAAAELARRLQEHRQQVATFRQRAAQLDGLTWGRLDADMQKLFPVLRKVVWDARLDALLESM